MTYDDEARPDTSVALTRSRAVAGTVSARRAPSGRGENGATIVAARPAEPAGTASPIVEAALRGLLAPRKTLPPALFYDEEGCRLFYEITKLPQYYLTRTEFGLLETTAPQVAALLPAGSTLVEYGASDEAKAEMLLRATDRDGRAVFASYIPIDVAAPALFEMRDRLAARRPGLTVRPVVADFLRPIALPPRPVESALMGFFPGSTIGNLEPDAATAFLRRARTTLGPDARLLLGFDTCRDADRLIPAYDDPAGITAQFNRNLLVRLNREAAASFDPESFAHQAVWNDAESRIEMHLVSRLAQTVTVAGQPIRFARDETIHTENSYKYAPGRMRALIRAAGWDASETWLDSNNLFAIWLLS